MIKFAVLVLTVAAACQMFGQVPEREHRCELDAAPEEGTLRVGSIHPNAKVCNVRFGNMVHQIPDAAKVTVKLPSRKLSGPVYIYVDAAGDLIAGSTVNLLCTGCRYVPEVTQFPADSIPLFTWTIVQGKFTLTGTDWRAELSTKNIAAGWGIIVTEKGGTATVGIDDALVSVHVIVPPKTSSSPCSASEFSFDSEYYYVCVAVNKWKRVALSSF